jgi:hypothetical protein
MKCEGYLTSRGEQLLRRHWEETAMCISCVHYDDIFIRWKPFIVQCTYAYAALLPKSGCLPGRGTCFARLGCELGLNLPELATLFGQLTREGKIATLTGQEAADLRHVLFHTEMIALNALLQGLVA